MRKNYENDAARLGLALAEFERTQFPLPGITNDEARAVFIDQIIDSEQRVLYTDRLLRRDLDPLAEDPASDSFDPLKAAILLNRRGNFDEAVWMVYLFVHFGKHRRSGWRYIRDIYGRLGQGGRWNWADTSADPTAFRFWLDANQDELKDPSRPHGFGNHRKYESLAAWTERGTGAAVQSYVEWVLAAGGDHQQRFTEAEKLGPEDGFDYLYRSMRDVRQFGRIARFDYLTMLGKLDLLAITPPHSYLIGATGPLMGARLLLDDHASSAKVVQGRLQLLADGAKIPPHVLEDAVCNWQKAPTKYAKFSG